MNNNFNIIGLDFEEVKNSLKQYLKSQDTLKDYNFDGSILNTIMDVLSYNTHYQAFYANMIANEMFLDTAVLRSSVSSHAKSIGYTPRSNRAASVVLDFNTNAANSANQLIQRGTEFIGADSAGTQYRFISMDSVISSSPGFFKDVLMYEGSLKRISYVYDTNKKDSVYVLIPNDKIDTRTIRVSVSASLTDTTGLEDVWTQTNSYLTASPESKIFFIQEKEIGLYELYFGDNFLGKRPNNGSIVTLQYIETNGDEGNGISNFTSSISNDIRPKSSSQGGSKAESTSDIKFLAPKYYQSGGRAVTEDDYVSSVIKEYPNTDSVRIYGGETTTPPQYGKVFVAIKPRSGSSLTSVEKDALKTVLQKNSSVVTIIPEIVDPEYTDIVVSSVVTFNPNNMNMSIGGLKSLISAYLFMYSVSELESFGSNLYLSKITQNINNINDSILSNETKILLRKTTDVSKFNISKGFFLDFKNPIAKNNLINVVSNKFNHKNRRGIDFSSCSIEDDGMGLLNVVQNDESTSVKTIVFPSVGSVDYTTGIISFNSKFLPYGLVTGPYFVLTVTPKNDDIYVFENNILRISRVYRDSLTIDVIAYEERKRNLNS